MNLRKHLCMPDGLTITINIGELRRFVAEHDALSDVVEEHVRSCEQYGLASKQSAVSFEKLRAALSKYEQKKL